MIRICVLLGLIILLIGCRSAESNQGASGTEPVSSLTQQESGTTEPDTALTLQASIAATAAWVSELEPFVATPTSTGATLQSPDVDGLSLSDLTGSCSLPAGYTLHERQTFCAAAPSAWISFNVDGGMAAALNTTPGQVLSISPDWAASTAECHLMIYTVAENHALDHLQERYRTYSERQDLTNLSSLSYRVIGEMIIPGFDWVAASGESGMILADDLTPTRFVHIGFSGSNCPLEELLPVLSTLRFNIVQ
nr:hypothetical protein [Anaerolineae bacterium]